MTQIKEYPVNFVAEAKSSGKMRNDITVHWPDMKETYQFATDEGPALGGEGTAPPPLALFVAGLAGCLMTNIRMMARGHGVVIGELRLAVRANWLRKVAGRGPHVAGTHGFEIDIELDSEASDTAVRALIASAKAGCFIEDSIVTPGVITHRLRRGDNWEDV